MDSSNEHVCVLCQRSEENKVTGALSSKEEVTAHQNCLLYSSGLFCRDSPQFDDLFGFSAEDVLLERQRGLKLTCSKCKKKGATVGCEIKRCKKSYHYPCAIQAKARTFEDKKNGRFGLLCFCCKEKQCQVGSNDDDDDDDDSFDTFTCNPKRKLDFGERQEVVKTHKRSRRLSTDSTDCDTDEQAEMLAPIESDFEENDNSAPDELSCLQVETSDVSMDSSLFWRNCTAAGCTQAIFEDFNKEMTDVFTRITSGQASKQDCDVAFNIMMASGKLKKLVIKRQKDLQKQLVELQQAATTLNNVVLHLPK